MSASDDLVVGRDGPGLINIQTTEGTHIIDTIADAILVIMQQHIYSSYLLWRKIMLPPYNPDQKNKDWVSHNQFGYASHLSSYKFIL